MLTGTIVGPVSTRGPGSVLKELGPWLKAADLAEFDSRFGTEAKCRDFLFNARFPNGFTCSECAGRRARWLDWKRLRCLGCRRKTSLTAETVLHGTRKPLVDWFLAAFLVVHERTSARTLQRAVGLTYKVAWTWAHKLRRVMGIKTTLDAPLPPFTPRPGQRRVFPHARSLWFLNHGGFMVSATREETGNGCCSRLLRADWTDGPPGSLRCSTQRHYPGVQRHRDTLFATYMGSVSDKHLRSYLDETEFRVNHRAMAAADRVTELMGRIGRTRPTPYQTIRGPRPTRSPVLFVGREAEAR
jgi:transposase-like protein